MLSEAIRSAVQRRVDQSCGSLFVRTPFFMMLEGPLLARPFRNFHRFSPTNPFKAAIPRHRLVAHAHCSKGYFGLGRPLSPNHPSNSTKISPRRLCFEARRTSHGADRTRLTRSDFNTKIAPWAE